MKLIKVKILNLVMVSDDSNIEFLANLLPNSDKISNDFKYKIYTTKFDNIV